MVQSVYTHPKYCYYNQSLGVRGQRDSYLLKECFTHKYDISYETHVSPEYHETWMLKTHQELFSNILQSGTATL